MTFKKIKCRCSCGKYHDAIIAGEQLDRLDLRNIDCHDCQEKRIKIAKGKEDGFKQTKR